MVDIAPFAAIRYENSLPLAEIVAPPYDVISPAQQDALYERHPHNVVRLELTKKLPGDSDLAPYERAAEDLAKWLQDGVLAKDSQPAFYVLSQTFTGPDGQTRTRTGFFGKARLTPFGEGPIMPHERTLRGPKLDRLRLYRAARTNLSPVFGMYQDQDGAIARVLERARQKPPEMSANPDGVQNDVWRIIDATEIEAIRAALASRRLYIADGHHRYETGLAYRDERRAHGGTDSEAGYESILMFSAAVEDPGMVVFPTHRLVHGLAAWNEAQLLATLAATFEITPAPAEVGPAIRALADAGTHSNSFLWVTKTGRYLLQRRKDIGWHQIPNLPNHESLRTLDVAILHNVILEHGLGITAEAQAAQTNIRYSKDNAEAFGAPQNAPDIQAAFLMNPTKVSEVIAVADAGLVMPQKSTFFYPKIPTGLVFYPLD